MVKESQHHLLGKARPVSFVIAALKGGAGKTFVSIGLAGCFRNNNLRVVTFKKGPDYIDGAWLAEASGRPCFNLDRFLMSPDDVVESFVKRSVGADVCIVEGNRGLFDGVDEEGSCSTAELAKMLGLPVILVLDVTKTTRTAAALVYGCQKLDQNLKIAGVILNQVGTPRQEKLITRAIEEVCRVPVLGALPKLPDNVFPERHLGLVTAHERSDIREAVAYAEKTISTYVDTESICKIVLKERVDRFRTDSFVLKEDNGLEVKDHRCLLAVIRDEAFQFYYPENLEDLERSGARLIYVSAIRDRGLPDGIDGIYIGGGFPEIYLEPIVGNKIFQDDLRSAVESGMPVYAECGGLMYLSDSLVVNGSVYPMVGIFPLVLAMHRKPQGHGYTAGEIIKSNAFFPVGSSIRGHEFHYSSVLECKSKDLSFMLKLRKGHGIVEQFDGIMYKNTVALYTHIHALSCKEWAREFVKAACFYKYRMKRGSFNYSKIPVS